MALLTLPHFGARQATPAVRFDPDGELAAAQKRLLATNAYVTRRRAVQEAYRAACDAGVVFSDTPASFGLDTPDGDGSAATQPLSPSQIQAARRLAHASAAPYPPSAPAIQDARAPMAVFTADRGQQHGRPARWATQRDARTPTTPQAAPYSVSSPWRPVGALDARAPATTAPVNAWAWRINR